MVLLIQARNEIAHYKMKHGSRKCFRDLEQRGIALSDKNTWPKRLSSLQGIRWVHNTACSTVKGLVDFIPAGHYRASLDRMTLPAFELLP